VRIITGISSSRFRISWSTSKPVEAREHDVEDHEIRAFLDGEVEAKLAIDRAENAVAGELKVIAQTK
jgi:hypothetical protein